MKLSELEALAEKATKDEWSVPHLCRDDVDCDCASILSEGYMGGIGEVWVDNGKRVGDGGNDCPPLSEAQANGKLIVYFANHRQEIINLVKAVKVACAASSNGITTTDGLRQALAAFEDKK